MNKGEKNPKLVSIGSLFCVRAHTHTHTEYLSTFYQNLFLLERVKRKLKSCMSKDHAIQENSVLELL